MGFLLPFGCQFVFLFLISMDTHFSKSAKFFLQLVVVLNMEDTQRACTVEKSSDFFGCFMRNFGS
jgi:hypothetical protein